MQENIQPHRIKILVRMENKPVSHCGYTFQIGNPVVAECYDFSGEAEFSIFRTDIECTLQVFRSQVEGGTLKTPKTAPRFFFVHKIKNGIHGDEIFEFDLDPCPDDSGCKSY